MRFQARRGTALTITSYNGGNFVKAGRELKEAFTKLSEGHFNDHVVNQGIELCLHYRLIKVVHENAKSARFIRSR